MGFLDSDIKREVDAVKGQTALLIWRDNKGDMESVPEKEYGKFYMGDCYIIYNCHVKKNGKKPVIHIHFLIGSESQGEDEAMDVALFATQLDEYLGGSAVQYREVMGNESVAFKSIFNGKRAPNLRCAKGGHDSRMKTVDLSNKTQLYEIKGARIARAVEVEVKLASLNSDDSYVLDGGKGLYVLLGGKSNRHEQAKAIRLANSIRDNEQGGRGKVIIIEEEELNSHSKRDEIRKLFELPSSAKLKFANLRRLQEKSDEQADKQAQTQSKLYKICDVGDRVEMKDLGPPKQHLLSENDCFILFTGRNVYVWKGRKASETERKQAMANARGFLKQIKENPNLGIVVMAQFAETAAFRACFPSWEDDSAHEPVNVDFSRPKGTGSNVAVSVHKVIDFRTLYDKPKNFVVDDPYANDDGQSNQLLIYKIDRLKDDGDNDDYKTLVEAGRNMVFNSGDCYVLVYQYGSGKCIVYYWLGNESPQINKGLAAKIAANIDDYQFGGLAVQERVIEGKEPPHFMRIFNGYILVKQDRLNGNPSHLYHVRAKKENDARVIEVEVDASNLNSNDSFILDSDKGLFLWYGKGSTGDEQKVVKDAAAKLDPKRGASGSHTFYTEGKEGQDFWNAIGGQKEYATQLISNLQDAHTKHEPRLFHCYNVTGSLEVEEVYEFDQDDLVPEDVFFLDTYYRLYIWVGKDARRDEKDDTIKFVREFINNDPTPRDETDASITIVKQGAEPDCLKAYFGVWEDIRTEVMSAEDRKRLAIDRTAEVTLEHEEEADPQGRFSLEELQGVPADELPYGINPEKRELYLLDDEFAGVFGMTKEEYKELPKWKKDQMRKKHGLF